MKSQYDILPGTVLRLPIDVPVQNLGLYGQLPPRLVSISSDNSNGIYGTGDEIVISLEFSGPVAVKGSPTMTLNTGCHDESCMTKEIQSFVCKADVGLFALSLNNQYINNIPANMTQDAFKYLLEQLDGVNEVTIAYSSDDDRDYSMGRRICTSVGKNVTITFESIDFPQFDGDVPQIQYDSLNQLQDPRTAKSMGEGIALAGVNNAYIASIKTNELVKGRQQRDSTATFYEGNMTSVLKFLYRVRSGDYSSLLEVKSLAFAYGFIYGAQTGFNVSTSVPLPQSGSRYMSIHPSSLGFNKNIVISSAKPTISSVTSPNADATYTQGDVIYIQVIFDLPIRIYNAQLFTLEMDTGRFTRTATFVQQLNSFTIEMVYAVQNLDSSGNLDYVSQSSFALNGGLIYRDAHTNETTANITLPYPGASNSLAGTKSIVVSTQAPSVDDIFINSTYKVYTAGEFVDIETVFDSPVQACKLRQWIASR